MRKENSKLYCSLLFLKKDKNFKRINIPLYKGVFLSWNTIFYFDVWLVYMKSRCFEISIPSLFEFLVTTRTRQRQSSKVKDVIYNCDYNYVNLLWMNLWMFIHNHLFNFNELSRVLPSLWNTYIPTFQLLKTQREIQLGYFRSYALNEIYPFL